MPTHGLFGAFSVRRPGPLALALLVWLALEVAAFALVIDRAGVLGALLIGAATSVAGVVMLRHVGRGAVEGLRRTAAGAEPQQGALLDGTLTALAGVLLSAPGLRVRSRRPRPRSLRGWIARRFAPETIVATRGPRAT